MKRMETRNIKVTAWIAPGLFKEGEILSGSTVESALSTLYETSSISEFSNYEIKLNNKTVRLDDTLVSDSVLILSKVKKISAKGPEYTPSDRIVVYYCPQREKKKRIRTIDAFIQKWEPSRPIEILVEDDRKGRTSFIGQVDLLDHHDVTLVVYDIEDLLNENVISKLKELFVKRDVRITLIVVTLFEGHPVAEKGALVRDHDDMIKQIVVNYKAPKKPQRSLRQYDVDRGDDRKKRNKMLWSWTTIVMGSYLDEKARDMVDLPYDDVSVLRMINELYSEQIQEHFGQSNKEKDDEPIAILFSNFYDRLRELNVWDDYRNLRDKNYDLYRKKGASQK
ncbi:hypothetical protein [Terasakiella pusilla]|uniref:hypothetical protein n=1 Tax=Terasakiella pusilla TaxID=64973 RepID=UPI003AA81D8C